MTLAPSLRKTTYNPAVSTATFLVGFPLFSDDSLKVKLDGVETVLFTVSSVYLNGRDDSASITLTSPVNGVTVTIEGDLLSEFESDYQANSPNVVADVQRDMEKIVARQQEQKREIDTTIGAADTLIAAAETATVKAAEATAGAATVAGAVVATTDARDEAEGFALDAANAIDTALGPVFTVSETTVAEINAATQALTDAGGGVITLHSNGVAMGVTNSIIIRSDVEYRFIGNPRFRDDSRVGDAAAVPINVFQTEDYIAAGNSGFTDEAFVVQGFKLSGRFIIKGSLAVNPAPGGASAHVGHGIAIFGRDFVIENAEIQNAVRNGLTTHYVASGTSPYNARVDTVTVDQCGEHGWDNTISDLQLTGAFNCASASQATDNQFDGLRTSSAIHGGNVTVWRKGFSLNAHRWSVNSSSMLTLHSASLETGKTGSLQCTGGRAKIGALKAYNMIGSTAPHIRLEGSNHHINGDVTQGGIGVTDGVLLRMVDASNCHVKLSCTATLSKVIEFSTPSQGANVLDISYFNSNSPPIITGTVNATDLIRFTQGGGKERSYTKMATQFPRPAASGTTQGAATLIEAMVVTVEVAGASNRAVRLPVATLGQTVTIMNDSASDTLLVFPATGEQIRGFSANLADTIPVNKGRTYACGKNTQWWVVG